MDRESGHSHVPFSRRIVGGLVGAFSGAILRFLVAISFLIYGIQTNPGFWGKEIPREGYTVSAFSALFGIVIGGFSGSTCHPKLGAILGAILSGGVCFVFFVVPMEFAIALTHGAKDEDRIPPVIGGIAMTVAGAFAGALGAWVGRGRQGVPK